jgi:hypothetical protein
MISIIRELARLTHRSIYVLALYVASDVEIVFILHVRIV